MAVSRHFSVLGRHVPVSLSTVGEEALFQIRASRNASGCRGVANHTGHSRCIDRRIFRAEIPSEYLSGQ